MKIGSAARYEIELPVGCQSKLTSLGQGEKGLERFRFSDEKFWIR